MPTTIIQPRRNVTIERKEGKRITAPSHFQPFAGGGIGIIPRRVLPSGIKAHDELCSGTAVGRYSALSAFRLFEILLDVHPALKQAKSNNLRLVFGEGKTRFVAYTEGTGNGTGQGGKDERDDEKTSEIEDFFKSLPNETGGLVGIQTALAISGMVSGMGCLEAVPGPRGSGLHRLWVVDPLTIALGRPNDDPSADLAAYQRQGTGTDYLNLDWQELPTDRFKWAAIDATPNNPHGVGLFSAAFNEAFADFSQNQDTRDAVHNAAWARMDFKYKLERILAYGKEILMLNTSNPGEDGLTDLDRFMKREIQNLYEESTGMKVDDNLFHSEDIEVTPVPAADFTGIEGILQMLRHRLVQSLDELPTLMGINDGSTQTYTSVEWGIRAEKAQWLRDWVNQIIIWALELYYRLKGQKTTVRAECEPVRASDAKADEETRALKVTTEAKITARGLQTLSDESQKITGTGLPDDEAAKKRQAVAEEQTGEPGAMATAPASTEPTPTDPTGETKGNITT